MPTSEIRNEYLASGLCGSCGSRELVDGKTRCQYCLETDSAYRHAFRLDGIAQGASSIELFLNPARSRVGLMDIETTGLKGDFDIVFCVVVKIYGRDEIKVFKLKLDELDLLKAEKEMLRPVRNYLRSLDGVISYYGCVTPGHRVLTSDFRWVPIETVKEGDMLLSFDATPITGMRRKWKKTKVVATALRNASVAEIKLSDGTTLLATYDHPWLISTDTGWTWINTKDLRPGGIIKRILPTWDQLETRESGWLAAFFDSEGSLAQYKSTNRWGKYTLAISASQNPNSVLEEAQTYLRHLGFDFSVRQYDPSNRKIRSINIKGGVPNLLKFLGSVRPNRLLERFCIEKLGSIKSDYHPEATVLSIQDAGTKKVVALGTESNTYIVEGFGSHNTNFDVPFLRTRMMSHGLTPIGKVRHLDVYYTARRTLLLSRNRLANVVELLQQGDGTIPTKTRVAPPLWMKALYSRDEKALQEIVDHCVGDVQTLEAALIKLKTFAPDRVLRR